MNVYLVSYFCQSKLKDFNGNMFINYAGKVNQQAILEMQDFIKDRIIKDNKHIGLSIGTVSILSFQRLED